MILATSSFSLHYYYVYNFEKSLLNTTYTNQFTIFVYEIVLNTTPKKKKKGSIVSSKLNGSACDHLTQLQFVKSKSLHTKYLM